MAAAALTASAVLALASVYPDWDPQWIVFQVFDAGTGNGESSGRPDAYNPAGPFRGLLQIWDANAVRFGYQPEEMYEPAKNLDVGHRLWLERGTAPWPSASKYVKSGPNTGGTMIAPDLVRLSPNVNDAPMPPTCKTVIIHATRSGVSLNRTEFDGTLNYMSQPGTTSSHWVISRTGVACRVVPDNRQAWHASEDNDNAWGIELEQGAEADGFTVPQIDKLVAVCRGYIADFGVVATHAATSAGPGFIGHQETAQGKSYGKTDPGRLFPWENFIARLRVTVPAPVVGDDEMFNVQNSKKLVGEVTSGDYAFDLARFGVPAGKRARLQVWYGGATPLEFYHGLDNRENRDAGRVYQPYSTVEVIASADGRCYVGPPGLTFDVQALGWYS